MSLFGSDKSKHDGPVTFILFCFLQWGKSLAGLGRSAGQGSSDLLITRGAVPLVHSAYEVGQTAPITGNTRRPLAQDPAAVINLSVSAPTTSQESRRLDSQAGLPQSDWQDSDEPLAALTGGLSIFSDVARPLRHLSLEQLSAAQDEAAEVVRVRLAKPRPMSDDTTSLIARRYASRGYQVPRPSADPNVYTFAAYDDGQLVGTVSMRFDSRAGLVAEQLYPDEIESLRAHDHRLCEFTRLALDVQATSKDVLGALFHACYLYAHVVCGLTHAVIEVNPRHVAFYRRVLHFRQLGGERHNLRVDAPAVLLALDFSVIAGELDRFFANPAWRAQTKSFFVHWFSPEDAEGIVNRLRREQAAAQAAA